MSSNQMTMVCLNQLVNANHQYRKFKELKTIESKANYKGYGILRLFKCLLLQFIDG
ncbi:MAG: hypothetical protein LF885_06260 [Rickettsia endosymbiont of Culicoides impunctatus]|nr:MAG: hypothetical protein LF885_06260 [Rickettsia endosymbiont of Culicoides impunctatus]